MSDIIPVAPVHHVMSADEIEEETGYRLGVGRVPKPKEIHEFIVHEEWMKHDNQLISVVGKNMEQINKERKDLEAKGYHYLGQDSFNVIMQTVPRKPIGYLHEYKGTDKTLRQYREGVKMEDAATGTITEVSPQHYRTWGSPGYSRYFRRPFGYWRPSSQGADGPHEVRSTLGGDWAVQ